MASTLSGDFTIEKIAPGVFAAIARAGGAALSNSTIVDLGDSTVVFDAMLTPRAGATLATAARRLTGRRPDFVVESHYHFDHVWGAGAANPLHVVASRRTRELLERKGREPFLTCRREFSRELARLDTPKSPIPAVERPFHRGMFEGVLAMPRSFRVRLPDLTVASEMELHGSRRTLRLITWGGGHSPSDLFGYLEDERIAMVGDLVVTRMHPSLGDGFPAEWTRILRGIRRLRPAVVVPGHGPVGGHRDVTRIEQYIDDLTRLVRRAGLARVPLDSIRVPERYQSWSGSFSFGANVARVDQQLRSAARRDSQ